MNKLCHDAHFHLDLYDNISEIIEQIENRQIHTIAVTNLPVLYHKLNKKIHSKYIRVALGFHPELITQYGKYIHQMWDFLEEERYIGEVGLDLINKTKIDYKNQIRFFEELINRCNHLGGKILSVHSRGSEKEVLSIIGNNFNGKIILHWYSGGLKLLDEAAKKRFYFSVNYSMVQSSKGKKIIERIPDDRILIESDGPFIRIYKKIFQPHDLEKIIIELAQIKGIDLVEMERILTRNFKLILLRRGLMTKLWN